MDDSLPGGAEGEGSVAAAEAVALGKLRRVIEIALRVAAATKGQTTLHARLFASKDVLPLIDCLNRVTLKTPGPGVDSEAPASPGPSPRVTLARASDPARALIKMLIRLLTILTNRRRADSDAPAKAGDNEEEEEEEDDGPEAEEAEAEGRDGDAKSGEPNGAEGSRVESFSPVGYALLLLGRVLRCCDDWPLGMQKGLGLLDLPPEPSSAGPGECARWEADCSLLILSNSTWQQYYKQLASDPDLSDVIAAAAKVGRSMAAAVGAECKALEELHKKKRRSRCEYDEKMQARRSVAFSSRVETEASRRFQLENRFAVSKRTRFRTLQHIFRNLSNERGPWCPYSDTDFEHGTSSRRRKGSPVSAKRKRARLFRIVKRPRMYWKMDKSESPFRVRNKLKVNYSGSEHKGCKRETHAEKQRRKQQKGGAPDAADPKDDGKQEEEESAAVITKAIKVSLPLLKDEHKQKAMQKPEHKYELQELMKEEKEELRDAQQQDSADPSALKLRVECVMMTPAYSTPGFFIVTARQIQFEVNEEKAKRKQPQKWLTSEKRLKWEDSLPQGYDRKWEVNSIRAILFRRKKLRQTALEIFFENNTNCFFNFDSPKVRRLVYRKVCSILPDPDAGNPGSLFSDIKSSPFYFSYKKAPWILEHPAKLMERSGLTKMWQERRISNFDYLMMLNTIAGRTYNDLSQYPVMPWVIKDYTSRGLDLKDRSIYRDLSKPIGAQRQDRLEKHFMTRYRDWDEEMMKMPPFMYGTHYSSAGYVLYYMIRMEPFTTEGIRLQSGRFDNPNRMFHSIPMAWSGCQTGYADVKELIPEWYYQPEMFRNNNRYDMGTRDSGEKLHHVILPPWASSPEEFVRISREALESEYVSNNLHHWIDLIFGDKQQGKKAVAAYNVFCHYTYENAVDIDAIEDETQKNSVLAQIEEFGQCPSQLFYRPHPRRNKRESIDMCVFNKLSALKCYVRKKKVETCQVVSIAVRGECVITIGEDRHVSIHKWRNATADFIPPFTFELEKKSYKSRGRKFGVEFVRGLLRELDSRMFAITNDERCIISCGHWDNSFKFSWTETGKVMKSIVSHKDVVTCLALSRNNRVLVTGSKDTTVMVWNLDPVKNEISSTHPIHILYGHDDEVTCVTVDVESDVVISGSKDGTCIIYTLRSGTYVRSIYPAGRVVPIKWVGMSSTGTIMTYSGANLKLHSYTINGRILHTADTKMQLTSFYFSENGKHLVMGGSRGNKGVFVVLTCHSLRIKYHEETPEPIRSFAVSPNEHHILLAMEDGSVMVFALNETVMQKITLLKLKMLGF